MKKYIILLLVLLISCAVHQDICQYEGYQVVEKYYSGFTNDIPRIRIRVDGEIKQIIVVEYDYARFKVGDYIVCEGNK